MKKIHLILASLALCATMSAQHVTPLNISLMDFSLDSLRIQFADDAPMYRAELERIQNVQNANEKALAQVRKELKDEKAHSKDLAAYYKEKESALASLQKAYEAELKALDKVENATEKLNKKIRKSPLMNKASVDSREDLLQNEKKEAVRLQEELTYRQKRLSQMLDRLHSDQLALANFDMEIKNKEVDLEQLEDMHKARKESVKTELKNVKAAMKSK